LAAAEVGSRINVVRAMQAAVTAAIFLNNPVFLFPSIISIFSISLFTICYMFVPEISTFLIVKANISVFNTSLISSDFS
jgi:hypothetical protein